MSTQHQTDKSILSQNQEGIKPPSMYAVVLKNDDFTPMDFVVSILMEVFKLSQEKSFSLMIEVHNQGKGIAGVFTREIAETKIDMCHMLANRHGHPFRCDLSKV